MDTDTAQLPQRLTEIIGEFAEAPRDVVMEMLLEYADAVPPVPPKYADHRGMEQVVECQTPFFLHATVTPERTVDVIFDCPPESPTTRAFAGILAEGLEGASPEQVLAVPNDLYQRMRLAAVISPLRVRGGTAILARLQRQVREQ